MDLNRYQKEASVTAIYPRQHSVVYPLLGLTGEVGEFNNKYKKVLRDGTEFSQEDMEGEIGDILWYLAALCTDLGLSMGEIANQNILKLRDRQARNVLRGSGDKR